MRYIFKKILKITITKSTLKVSLLEFMLELII